MVLPNIEMNPPQVYMCSPSWTLLPPPSPYYPSGSSQCTSPKHPVSCIEPGLATRSIYDIICISMPFSQIIPPSPSPTEFRKMVTITLYTRQQKRHWCIVMLPKAHLISHSRMSGYRWVITPLWLSGCEDLFCIVLCVFLPHLNIFCFC